jgi:hypothetical protein
VAQGDVMALWCCRNLGDVVAQGMWLLKGMLWLKGM